MFNSTESCFMVYMSPLYTVCASGNTLCLLMCLSVSLLLYVIQAAVGNHPVQDVYMSSNTKKLLIRLADSCDRLQSKQT